MRKPSSRFRSSKHWVALILLSSAPAALAAPCCGGASVLPSLITGDDRAQASASVVRASVIGDAPDHGVPVFRSSSDSEVTETFKLDGAYQLVERLQLGGSVPVLRRSRQVGVGGSQSTGLGDVSADAAYEFLPEWGYSVWKPRGFTYLTLTAPTGRRESIEPFAVDERGHGFWTASLGAIVLKGWGNWDATLAAEAHYSLASEIAGVSQQPGPGASALAGGGWSPRGGPMRIGLSLSPQAEGRMRTTGEIDSSSEPKLVWNTFLQIRWAISSEFSAALTYNDQTLVGPARNVPLSRSVAFSAQKRWQL